MSEEPPCYIVESHIPDYGKPMQWGPFLDIVEAQRCVVALAGNPKVLQANVLPWPKKTKATYDELMKIFKGAAACQPSPSDSSLRDSSPTTSVEGAEAQEATTTSGTSEAE